MEKMAECGIRVDVGSHLRSGCIRGGNAAITVRYNQGTERGPQLVIKGEHLQQVMRLVTLMRSPDEAVAPLARKQWPECAEMSDADAAATLRVRVLAELKELAGD